MTFNFIFPFLSHSLTPSFFFSLRFPEEKRMLKPLQGKMSLRWMHHESFSIVLHEEASVKCFSSNSVMRLLFTRLKMANAKDSCFELLSNGTDCLGALQNCENICRKFELWFWIVKCSGRSRGKFQGKKGKNWWIKNFVLIFQRKFLLLVKISHRLLWEIEQF